MKKKKIDKKKNKNEALYLDSNLKKEKEENQAAPREVVGRTVQRARFTHQRISHLTSQLTSWPSCLIFLEISYLMNYI